MPSIAKIASFKFTKQEEIVAKAIYETKYPYARWDNLHPRRDMRFQRMLEARAAIQAMRKRRKS